MAAVRFTIQGVARTSEMFCREGPEAIRTAAIRQVDALLVDQMEPAGGAIADHLGLPFITVCNALAINRDSAIPPPFTPWRYSEPPGLATRIRNRIGYALGDRTTKPITRVIAKYRRAWKLPPLATPDDSFSRLAQICQMPRELDYPRTTLPAPPSTLRRSLARAAGDNTVPLGAAGWPAFDLRIARYAPESAARSCCGPLTRPRAWAANVQLVISHGGGLERPAGRRAAGHRLLLFPPRLSAPSSRAPR